MPQAGTRASGPANPTGELTPLDDGDIQKQHGQAYPDRRRQRDDPESLRHDLRGRRRRHARERALGGRGAGDRAEDAPRSGHRGRRDARALGLRSLRVDPVRSGSARGPGADPRLDSAAVRRGARTEGRRERSPHSSRGTPTRSSRRCGDAARRRRARRASVVSAHAPAPRRPRGRRLAADRRHRGRRVRRDQHRHEPRTPTISVPGSRRRRRSIHARASRRRRRPRRDGSRARRCRRSRRHRRRAPATHRERAGDAPVADSGDAPGRDAARSSRDRARASHSRPGAGPRPSRRAGAPVDAPDRPNDDWPARRQRSDSRASCAPERRPRQRPRLPPARPPHRQRRWPRPGRRRGR